MERIIKPEQSPSPGQLHQILIRWLDNTLEAPDLGGAISLMHRPWSQTDAAYGGHGRYIGIPHHPARHFGGLFCGQTPDL